VPAKLYFSASSSNLSGGGCTTPGHPTLGTAWLIRDQIIRDGISSSHVDKVTLNLKVGQIPVTFEGDVLWMKQIQPTFMQTCTPAQVARPPSRKRFRFALSDSVGFDRAGISHRPLEGIGCGGARPGDGERERLSGRVPG
jgi:hypothetical protein